MLFASPGALIDGASTGRSTPDIAAAPPQATPDAWQAATQADAQASAEQHVGGGGNSGGGGGGGGAQSIPLWLQHLPSVDASQLATLQRLQSMEGPQLRAGSGSLLHLPSIEAWQLAALQGLPSIDATQLAALQASPLRSSSLEEAAEAVQHSPLRQPASEADGGLSRALQVRRCSPGFGCFRDNEGKSGTIQNERASSGVIKPPLRNPASARHPCSDEGLGHQLLKAWRPLQARKAAESASGSGRGGNWTTTLPAPPLPASDPLQISALFVPATTPATEGGLGMRSAVQQDAARGPRWPPVSLRPAAAAAPDARPPPPLRPQPSTQPLPWQFAAGASPERGGDGGHGSTFEVGQHAAEGDVAAGPFSSAAAMGRINRQLAALRGSQDLASGPPQPPDWVVSHRLRVALLSSPYKSAIRQGHLDCTRVSIS